VVLSSLLVLGLVAFGCTVVLVVADAARRRLGLGLWSLLLWLGLAEDPREAQLARQAGRPRLTVVDSRHL